MNKRILYKYKIKVKILKLFHKEPDNQKDNTKQEIMYSLKYRIVRKLKRIKYQIEVNWNLYNHNRLNNLNKNPKI
jgi:hypothetical protein